MEPVAFRKRTIGLAGAVVCLLAVLAGCTRQPASQGTPAATAAQDTRNVAPTDAPAEPEVAEPQPTPAEERAARQRAVVEDLQKELTTELERLDAPGEGPLTMSRPVIEGIEPNEEPAGPDEKEPSELEEAKEPVKPDAKSDESAEPPPRARPAADLGPPLVEKPEKLVRLDPTYPVWLDPAGKRVVMVGEICMRGGPLEMFACLRGTKEHESIVSVPTRARVVHAGLLAAGAKTGQPVAFHPEYVPATGTEIAVTVHWKDNEGKLCEARAQDWVRDIRTKKAMTHPWVFAGSGFWTDEETGTRHYQAESGDFICVSNFPSAMLDLPVPSTDQADGLLFEAFTERIPPLGTPVTVVLAPVTKNPEGQPPRHEAANPKASSSASGPSAK